MVVQYPYVLEEYQVANATKDGSGDWSKPSAAWVEISKCRDEGNGGGNEVRLTDGTTIVYSSLIQLPRTCPAIKAGAMVRVLSNEVVRVEGKVLRYVADQLHSRLWL